MLILSGLVLILCGGALQFEPVGSMVNDAIRKIILVKESTADLNVPIRSRTWIAAKNIIGDHLWFGVGYSSVNEFLESYGSLKYLRGGKTKVISLHGGFLKFGAYGGLLALGVFLYFFKTLVSIALKAYRSGRNVFQRCAGYHLFILLMILIPMNIAADSFGLSITWIIVFYLLTNALVPSSIRFSTGNRL